MSLGNSNMAGGVLGMALLLLLLASIIQGLQDVEVFHHEKVDAVSGQNVTLPCTIKNNTALEIVSIEWSKNGNTKLALYHPRLGFNIFLPDTVTMQAADTLMGSYLHLYRVAKQDSGLYICDISSFPYGSIRSKTVLEIKDDVELMCDMDSAIEVHTGENVTIGCGEFPDAKYKWTKNGTLVSEDESLELCWVTDAHAGIYKLTVNTQEKSLHKEFIVTVIVATTSLRTDLVTVPQPSNVTEEGLIASTDSSHTTSPATRLPTTATDTTWTMNTVSTVTDDYSNSRNVTAEEHNSTHISVTASPVTHIDINHNHSTERGINPTHNSSTSTMSDQSVDSNLTTTSSYGNKVFRSTQKMDNVSTQGNLGSTLTVSTGNVPTLTEDQGTDGIRNRLLLWLIIIPILVLIAVAGFLYMRQTLKARMDQPPPFKPPPPPVKYTAARHYETSTHTFPTSRCNSVTEPKYMKHIY